jgi:hypothetical protein
MVLAFTGSTHIGVYALNVKGTYHQCQEAHCTSQVWIESSEPSPRAGDLSGVGKH